MDDEKFRFNVGMVILNAAGQVFWARRREPHGAWQFPQGGIDPGEALEQAMFRELKEEVGLEHTEVALLARSERWLSYRLPEQYRSGRLSHVVGQKQKWFLLRLVAGDENINLEHGPEPELVEWRWVDYWYPVEAIIEFKRAIYRAILTEFSAYIE